MNDWLTYARKNEAFTQKHKGKVKRALNDQLKRYADSYQAGRPNLNIFTDNGPLISVILDIYGDVGGHFARTTNVQLRRDAGKVGRGQNTTGQFNQIGKSRNPGGTGQVFAGKAVAEAGILLRRGSLGFSLDWANRIIERLRISAINLAQKISGYTRQKVLDILEEAQAENLTLDETVQRITSEVQDLNEKRAETIARTEVGRAAGEGKMIGAKALGVEMDKVWISARDHRTRTNPKKDPRKGDHWVLNEQVKPMDEPFSNGVHLLMQPGDPNAPPAETVNCRCTCVFKVRKDEQGNTIPKQYVDHPVTGMASVVI